MHLRDEACLMDIVAEGESHEAYLAKLDGHHGVCYSVLREKREYYIERARAVICNDTHKFAAERALP